VLSGVDEQRLDSGWAAAHLIDHRRDLHEIWPGADDVDYSEHRFD
jgi:hypothetical protein